MSNLWYTPLTEAVAALYKTKLFDTLVGRVGVGDVLLNLYQVLTTIPLDTFSAVIHSRTTILPPAELVLSQEAELFIVLKLIPSTINWEDTPEKLELKPS